MYFLISFIAVFIAYQIFSPNGSEHWCENTVTFVYIILTTLSLWLWESIFNKIKKIRNQI